MRVRRYFGVPTVKLIQWVGFIVRARAVGFGDDRGASVGIMRVQSSYVLSSDVYFKLQYKQDNLYCNLRVCPGYVFFSILRVNQTVSPVSGAELMPLTVRGAGVRPVSGLSRNCSQKIELRSKPQGTV